MAPLGGHGQSEKSIVRSLLAIPSERPRIYLFDLTRIIRKNNYKTCGGYAYSVLKEGSLQPSEACRYEYRSYSPLPISLRRSGRRFNRFSEDTHLACLGLELTLLFECAGNSFKSLQVHTVPRYLLLSSCFSQHRLSELLNGLNQGIFSPSVPTFLFIPRLTNAFHSPVIIMCGSSPDTRDDSPSLAAIRMEKHEKASPAFCPYS